MDNTNEKSNVWSIKSIDGEISDLVIAHLNRLNLPDNAKNRKRLIYGVLKEPKDYPISKEAFEKTMNRIFKINV